MSAYDKERAWSDFRVGSVTLVAAFFIALSLAFAGGDKGLLFHPNEPLRALLDDVNGLKKGSSVAMGGMTVGKVTDIAFVNNAQSNAIEVLMQVRSDVRRRIKRDSKPSVRTQGMMGDRYVDISAGSKESEALRGGERLFGTQGGDFDATLLKTTQVLTEAEKLLSAVNEQRGTVGQLFYDEKFYQNLTDITNELKELIKDFKKQPRKYIKFSLF